MPIKPDMQTRGAAKAVAENSNFSRDALEAIINETPELRDALLREGLVEEVKS